MFKPVKALSGGARLALLIVAATVTAALSGCIVAPPPRVVYAAPPPPPPPPPPVAAPAADVEIAAQATEPPPALPEYEQPPCPVAGYMWTPGYWAYAPAGYFWVPGTWVAPPRVGVLWTPGYWGFVGGVYMFHAGYWGPHVGFYGGVSYGFGYTGVGFAGGRWVGGGFAYNQAVTNVNVTVVHNTYNETVINNNVTVNRTSYNGGSGGIAATPTAQERAAAAEPHVPPTPAQHAHMQQAASNPALAARNNGGKPSIAATARPGAFSGPGVVGAHGASAPPPHAPAAANNTNHQPKANNGKPQQAGAKQQQAGAKQQPTANKPHPKQPQPENGKHEGHEPETAQR
jgi:hypothetical protein